MTIELAAEQMAAPRDYLDDDKFMAQWPRMHPEIKRELLRMEREIKQGIAILKDRRVGRPKKDQTGFYGLELAETDVYQLEAVPRKAAELEKARARLAKLKAGLTADEIKLALLEKRDADLEPFWEYAAAQGKTLREMLKEFTEIENALRRDFTEGFFFVCDRYGVDPVAFLQHQLRAA